MWLYMQHGKNLKEHSRLKDEVITFYAYFINDSIESLDLSSTIVTDYMPEGYEFLGFNTIEAGKVLSDPKNNATYSQRSFEILWVNDIRSGAASETESIQKNYPYNNTKENLTIEWEYDEVNSNIKFIPTGTLKPGEACYIIYSYKSINGYKENINTSIDWSFNNVPYVAKSNAINAGGFLANKNNLSYK